MKVFIVFLAVVLLVGQLEARVLSTNFGCVGGLVNCFIQPCMFARCNIPGAICKSVVLSSLEL